MIFKNSAILAFFSILSVLLGIFRDRLLATNVGIGPVLDVYNAAFRVPDLFYGMFLAFITAGTVIPFLTKENKEGVIEYKESEKRFSSLVFFFSFFMVLLIVIVGITIPYFAHLIVPGFNEHQISEFIFATRILMIQPLFLGISSLLSCFAQLRNEFIFYGIAPLGYSFGIILGIVLFYKKLGIGGLILGVIMGACMSLFIQALSLRGHKFKISHQHFDINHIKEIFRFAIPRTGTNIVSQLRVVFFTAFATTLGPGVLSSFLFAQRITDAASQIISQSVTTVSLPVLSKEYAENRIKEHERLVYKYTVILFFIAVVCSVIIFLFKDLVIYLLYGDNEANELIATLLFGFVLALPFSMMSSFLVIGFYSMKRTGKVFVANLISTTLCIITSLYFRHEGIISLVYGISIYQISMFSITFLMYLKKKIKRNNLQE